MASRYEILGIGQFETRGANRISQHVARDRSGNSVLIFDKFIYSFIFTKRLTPSYFKFHAGWQLLGF
jgi:hypothetical protein